MLSPLTASVPWLVNLASKSATNAVTSTSKQGSTPQSQQGA